MVSQTLSHFRLSSVAEQYVDEVRELKTLLTIYATLVDDLVEDLDDHPTFEQAVKIPFESHNVEMERSGVNRDYLEYTRDVWAVIETRLTDAPWYTEFAGIFDYDLRQVTNAVRYSRIVNRNVNLANVTEAYAFDSYNMVVFPYTDVDLMHSPSFDRAELGDLRELIWTAQRMARIGNWVSTWEREFREGDLSSGVVAKALTDGVISPTVVETLQEKPTESKCDSIRDEIRAAGIEASFRDDWHAYRREIKERFDLRTVDVTQYLEGFRTVFEYQLQSEGYK